MLRNAVHRFCNSRSISFRLYLIIVPTTILAISFIGYLDVRIARRLLDKQVEASTIEIASQLSDDLTRIDAIRDPENIRLLLSQLVESNFFVTRIDVFRRSGEDLVRILTTSSAAEPPVTTDELSCLRQERLLVLPLAAGGERFLKVIAPVIQGTGSAGCVSVISTLRQSDLVADVHDQVALFLVPVSIAVLVLLLHYLFTRVLTGRIARLGDAMIQARRGELSSRTPIDRRDELGTIARLFNEAMGDIESASLERDRLLEEQKTFNQKLQVRVKEATRELSAANRHLRQVNRDLFETQRLLTKYERMAVAGQMAAAFAHEIGSPLSAISTHLDLMGEDPETTEGNRRRLELVTEQVNRITAFVEETLSEIRAAAQPREKVQINEVLQRLLLFLSQHFEQRLVRTETKLAPQLPEIEANAQQLQQVFLNLLNNALDAMPSGGTVRIETRTETGSDGNRSVVVSISDTGTGIPKDEQKRIFEPFFSTKDLGRGTGLGLSIASRIIRQHQGAIELKSEPGEGTEFTIRFGLAPSGGKVGGRLTTGRKDH